MARIAFYAPLKSPNHPVPSGDRQMARQLMQALRGASGEHEVTLVSELRSYEGKGDPAKQAEIIASAETETDRIAQNAPFDLWVTYHNYYKAPDLLGPAMSARLGIAYVLFEATRARKRLNGPWSAFAARAEAANDAADVIFHFTQRDGVALHEQKRKGQIIAPLAPFLPLDTLPVPTNLAAESNKTILSVGMFRAGDKAASYQRIAEILTLLETPDWHLRIVGDGPYSEQIKALFAPFGARVTFDGQLRSENLQAVYQNAAVFLWPGINEAFGMVYLEAQAAGCPALAEDRPGVRDVLPASALTPMGDPAEMAKAVDHLLTSPSARTQAAQTAHSFVQERHLFPAAQKQIFDHIDPLLKGH